MKILNFLTLLFILSCSSTEKKTEKIIIPKKIPYAENRDFLNNNSGVFFNETSDGLDVGSNDQDEIHNFVAQCRDDDYSDGLELANQLFGKYKAWPSYWNGLGICYYLKKDYFKAKLYFNRALEERKNYAPSINNLSLIFIKQKFWEKSLLALKEAYRLRPKSQVINYNLGRLYLVFGLGRQAIIHFQKIDDVSLYEQKVVKFMGIALSLDNQHRKAIQVFLSAKPNLQKEETFSIFYARSLYLSGQRGEAKEVLNTLDIGSRNKLYAMYKGLKEVLQ